MAVGRPQDYLLKVSTAASKDLQGIANGDEELLASLNIYLQELKDDQSLLGKLLEDKYGKLTNQQRYTHRIGVQVIGEFWRDRPPRDLWALKFWDLENDGLQLRFVYMYLPSRRWFIVLAVAPRSWNYASSDPLSDRIRADYDRFKRDYA